MSQTIRRPRLSEAEIIHNPALGAHLLWKTADAAQEEGQEGMQFASLFMILPLLLHRKTLSLVNSTQKASGLALFAAKLGEQQEELLALHDRALLLRDLTISSIAIAEEAKLIVVDYETARCFSINEGRKPQIPERIKPLTKGAEKIGSWLARLPLAQAAKILRVEF